VIRLLGQEQERRSKKLPQKRIFFFFGFTLYKQWVASHNTGCFS
jgi:hypothetical protein